MDKKGFTLVELIIVIAVIAILAMIAIPAYVGQQKKATRTEAFSNLQNLRLLEEQYYADNGDYTASAGTCQKDKNNVNAIKAVLPGFKPGSGLSYSYCIEQNRDIPNGNTDTTTLAPPYACFRATAFGNSSSRVDGDKFQIDCNNNKTF